jgi:hypothetical protein
MSGVSIDPRDCASNLLSHRHQTATGIMNEDEVRYDEVSAGVNEALGQICGVSRLSIAPGAAVNEDVDRRVGAGCLVNIEFFILGGAVGDTLRSNALEHRFTGKPATRRDQLLIGSINALVVSVVKLLLVHIEPDKGTLCSRHRTFTHIVSRCIGLSNFSSRPKFICRAS